MYQNIRLIKSLRFIIICVLLVNQFACTSQDKLSVKQVMDNKITELYGSKTEAELTALTYEQAKSLFSPADLKILSTVHWMFDVNVPVTVSVFRSKKQEIVPWWLKENGFAKTQLSVNNEMTEYEIWQKTFPAGHVGLGINGFENDMLHYFVAVQPQTKTDRLTLGN